MGFSTTGSAGGSAPAAFEGHNSSPVSSLFSFTTSFSDLICSSTFDNTSATTTSPPPPPLSSSGRLGGVPKFKSTPPPSLPISPPSHVFSIPAGISPTELLDSPVLLTSSTLLASPTTGALRAKLPDLCATAATNCNTNRSYQEAAASIKSEEDKSSSEFTFQSSHPSSFSNQFLSSENALKVVIDDMGGRQDELPQQHMMMPSFEDHKKQGSNEEESNCITTHYPNYYPQQSNQQQQQQPRPSNNNNFQSDVTMNHPVTTTSSEPTDEYNWRKYGQKQVKGSENPRSYYKCTHPGCPTKKKVERSTSDGKITEIVIKGDHSHPKPAKTRRSSSSSSFSSLATAITELPPPGVIIRPTPIPSHGGRRGGNDNSNNMMVDVHQDNSFGSTDQMDVSSLSAAIVAVGTPDTSSISVVDDEIDRGSSRSRSAGENNFTEDDDEDEDETQAKRWKGGDGESSEIISSGPTTTGNRTERETRVVVQTISDIDILDDGYRWRKYGQKVVKGNPNPRSYYKCTYPGCSVRKHVERAAHDIRAVLTTYEGKHFHQVPAARGSSNNYRTSHQLQCPLPQQPHLDYHHNHPNNNNNMISNLMMAASAIRSSVPLNDNHLQTTTTSTSSSALLQQYNMNNLNPVSSESRHEQSASAFLQDMMFHHQGSSIGGGGGFGFSSGSGELNIMGGGGGMRSSSLSSTAYYMNVNGNQSQQKNQH